MIALGSDHAGYEYKEKIKELLSSMGLTYQDFGTHSPASTDYPDYAHSVALAVSSGKADSGILVCGTGIGMAMVANKHNGIRAVAPESVESARLSREHNNANVLALGARITPWERAEEIIRIFLAAHFEGGRHESRLMKMHQLTNL